MASATETTTISPPSAIIQDDTHLWTPPQESALLQSLLHYKPVGLHKHFRMIAIHDHLVSTSLISPEDTHTSIAGIWRKLGTLYDLEGLDEREDSIISGAKDGTTDDDDYWREFELPREDFEELMWQKRLAPDGSVLDVGSSRVTSPATVTGTVGRRESTIADSEEPRSSPVSVSGVRTPSGRGRRAVRGGRLSRLQNEIETESGKGSRRGSKAASVVEREDSVMEDVEDEDGEEESGDEEDEGNSDEQDEDEEEAGTKRGAASKRGRGVQRGRARRGRRR